jgi:hypothetical protein
LVTFALPAACRPLDKADEFRNGVPREETVKMVVPAAAGARLEVESQAQALKGDTAEFYRLTRGVTLVVNGGAFFVGALVKAVVNHPPTSLTDDTAVWGPWSDALDPIEWKVTVKRVGDQQYDYRFEGRAKNTQNPYVVVLSGVHSAAVDAQGDPLEGFGAGTFVLDWDARNTLPMPGKDIGKAEYRYARQSLTTTVEIDAKFRGVKDDERPGARIDVDYMYRKAPGGAGSMEFSYLLPAAMAQKGARWAVKSRWQQTGAGRSDVRASGGDLPPSTTVTANECWDQSFASQFLRASWAPSVGWGNESTDCVFAAADYSTL